MIVPAHPDTLLLVFFVTQGEEEVIEDDADCVLRDPKLRADRPERRRIMAPNGMRK